MKRHHHMPFGAEPLSDGHIRFRLWAPTVQHVDVCLENPAGDCELVPLTVEPGGWHGGITARATVGSRYCYRLADGMSVPDPASRWQPDDVHCASEVFDPRSFEWQDDDWRGCPWEEAVIYELHVGSFTPQGTFTAVRDRLAYLADLGITAIELMPVADFPGRRNWGYDATLPFAPDSRYGHPDELKALVQAAHGQHLMVFLDVVYNHFGPEGNYLQRYAPAFFSQRHHTPWGAALNFDGPESRVVRDFFIHNALYWLEEYHFDGLRLDAVHEIQDDSHPDILDELAAAVAAGPGRHRHVHLILENDANAARYLDRAGDGRPRAYVAQWNDDFHHACHVLLTDETQGYYRDYADDPLNHLARCLCEGFSYQGQASAYREGQPRGEPSGQLPPTAFVAFLQNHDQIGNRAFGERLTALAPPAAMRAATALLLLAPATPLLFMGQEWGTRRPFPFFCDFAAELAVAVTEGRRQEFAAFPAFRDPNARARIPDPMAEATYASAVLDWAEPETPECHAWLTLHRDLLRLRRDWIAPRLHLVVQARWGPLDGRALSVVWRWQNGERLTLLANLAGTDTSGAPRPEGDCLYATHPSLVVDSVSLPAWGLAWYLHQQTGRPDGRTAHARCMLPPAAQPGDSYRRSALL
ncbi:MAG: malto-oligosyltrehalose trehalohydrolase [Gammaproteobacteria bacterium]